ncbi:MAG: LysR family transcriptional regulator [Candidatus Omnitrophica bacterium]|nr:LysR family transcriptional regulator [Candidatus Omnitrophota bacterium]
MVDLFFIKSFLAVAQTGSFRLAAQRNNITQPAVSQHIHILEQKLRCSLFERSSRKTILTPAGRVFLVFAQQMLDSYQNACTEIEKMNNLSVGTVRIASIYSIGLYQLKPLIQRLLKKYPKINIHLEYCHHSLVYQMVQDRSVDFGMVAFPKEIEGLQIKVFAHDQLTMVQSPKHRFFKKNEKITLNRLNNTSFVGIDNLSPTGIAINQFFKAHHINVNLVKEYENIETVKDAVEIGLGCSILPKTTIAQELKNHTLEIIPLQRFNLKRPLALVHSDKKVFTKAANIFLESFFSL